jgi:hypothetical protein
MNPRKLLGTGHFDTSIALGRGVNKIGAGTASAATDG